jgi:pimeloyl-ACP methyl ester carboxylesterase
MCDIRTIPGRGPFHFLCVPGLVPDGPETFLRQLSLLRSYGSVAVVTYPYDRFDLDAVITALRAHLDRATAAGRQVVLMGVSVGGGFCLELLRRARDAGQPLDLASFILVSPFTCIDDLAPLLGRLVDGIAQEFDRGVDGQPEQALERGRAFFRSLAAKSAGPKPATTSGWRSFFNLFTPTGLAELGEARIRARIERTLAAISSQGGIDRVLALRQLPGLERNPRAVRPLTTAPTLILWGSKERHTLSMEGPGTGVLCRPDLASRHFPDVEVHWVYAHDGEEVPHASLLKHSVAFNRHLRHFLKRRAKRFGLLPRMTLLARSAPVLLLPLLRGP